MSKARQVNDYVRRRIRELRKARGLTTVEFAKRLALPRTSYVSMERGAYNIKLDHVHRALEVLRADIGEVWPSDSGPEDDESRPVNGLQQKQLFRLEEIVDLSASEGGLLLRQHKNAVVALLNCGLRSDVQDRIAARLERDEKDGAGHWFSTRGGRGRYYLFLVTGDIDVSLMFLINRFLVTSCSLFDASEGPVSKSQTPSNKSQTDLNPQI